VQLKFYWRGCPSEDSAEILAQYEHVSGGKRDSILRSQWCTSVFINLNSRVKICKKISVEKLGSCWQLSSTSHWLKNEPLTLESLALYVVDCSSVLLTLHYCNPQCVSPVSTCTYSFVTITVQEP